MTLVEGSGDVVLVSAADGEHHLVTLPGFIREAAYLDQALLTLSPDGTELAYAWRADERAAKRWPSGVAVLHLDEPGRVDVHRLPGWGRSPRRLDHLVSGRPMADLFAHELTKMKRNGFTFGPTHVERLDTARGERVVVGPAQQTDVPSVSDDGVVLLTGDGLDLWSEGQRLAVDTNDPLVRNYGPSAWSPDGGQVAVAGPGRVDSFTVVDAGSLRARVVELEKSGPSTVMGWVGPDHVLLVRQVVPFDRTPTWCSSTSWTAPPRPWGRRPQAPTRPSASPPV